VNQTGAVAVLVIRTRGQTTSEKPLQEKYKNRNTEIKERRGRKGCERNHGEKFIKENMAGAVSEKKS